MFRSKWFALFSLVAVLGLLAGCVAPTPQVVEKVVEVEKVVTAVPEPQQGQQSLGKDTLVFALDEGVTNGLDATQTLTTTGFKVSLRISEGLTAFDWNTMEAVPNLAESWEVADDGQSVVLNLRKGVTFHDGTPFNADAVVFNLERVFNADHEYHNTGTYPYPSTLFPTYAGVEKIDDFTVKVTTSSPDPLILWRLSSAPTRMQSPSAVKEWGEDYTNHAVGTGPWKLVAYEPDVKVELERYEDYWGEKPAYQTLIFKVIRDDQAKVAELLAGTVDVVTRVPAEQMPVLENVKGINTYYFPTAVVGYDVYNCAVSPTDDVRVRKAITYAYDRTVITDKLRGGSQKPVFTQFLEGYVGYNPDVPTYEYDPEKAKALLDEAGWIDTNGDGIREKEGKPLHIRLMSTPDPAHGGGTNNVVYIQQALRQVGIDAEIVIIEHASKYTEAGVFGKENFEMAAGGMALLLPDLTVLYSRLETANMAPTGWNFSFYSNPKLDELIAAAQSTLDPDERAKLLMEAQQIVAEDLPWNLYGNDRFPVAASERVEGLSFTPVWWPELEKVTLAY